HRLRRPNPPTACRRAHARRPRTRGAARPPTTAGHTGGWSARPAVHTRRRHRPRTPHHRPGGGDRRACPPRPEAAPGHPRGRRRFAARAIGRKKDLFAGSDAGGTSAAVLYSLVGTCRRLGVDPFAYLRDALGVRAGLPAGRMDELLPDRWAAGR